MVGPRITATVNPEIKHLSEVFKLDARDMKRMTTSVDRKFRENERRQFSSEGSSGGRKWKRLAKSTLDAKKRARGGRRRAKARVGLGADVTGQAAASLLAGPISLKIMQRTGKLRKGLTQKSHPDHVANFSITQAGAFIRIGVKNVIAAYHGAVKGQRNPRLPKRNVMQMTQNQRRRYYGIVGDYLIKTKLDRVRRALRAGVTRMRAARRP